MLENGPAQGRARFSRSIGDVIFKARRVEYGHIELNRVEPHRMVLPTTDPCAPSCAPGPLTGLNLQDADSADFYNSCIAESEAHRRMEPLPMDGRPYLSNKAEVLLSSGPPQCLPTAVCGFAVCGQSKPNPSMSRTL